MKMKKLKPVEIDATLRYICPNKKCGYDHWLSLKEAQTKNFKIVCDCGTVFKPKQIKKIKVSFVDEQIKQKQEVLPPIKPTISESLLKTCVKILIGFGFTESESTNLIKNQFDKSLNTNPTALVKETLESMRNE